MDCLIVALTIDNQMPLAAGYIAASARTAGFDAQVLERNISYKLIDLALMNELATQILQANPKWLCFSCYIWNIEYVTRICALVKQLRPQMKIILGGPGVSFLARDVLLKNPSVDMIVRGEGEETIVEIMAGRRLETIDGISYRRSKAIRQNKDRQLNQDLDSLPSPFTVILPRSEAWIETHRGCQFRCAYCTEFKNFPGIRCFSAARIEQEIRLAINCGARKISLCNSFFNTSEQRVRELCEVMSHYKVQYLVDTYAELLTERMADLYKKAGIYGTEIGLQSTNPAALKAINRTLDKAKYARAVGWLKERGIRTSVQVILGLPEDTLEGFKETLDYVRRLGPDNVAIFRLLLLPGSRLNSRQKQMAIIRNPNPPYEVWQTGSFPAEDIAQAEIYAQQFLSRYYLRP